MEGSGNRYACHLGVNGLGQGGAVLDRFVGQVRAISGNENVRVHNCTPRKSASTVSGAVASAILHSMLHGEGPSLLHHRSDRPKLVDESIGLSFTADVFPRSSTISYSICSPSLSMRSWKTAGKHLRKLKPIDSS